MERKPTPFEIKVYDALCRVPAGKVVTYKTLGAAVGCKSGQAIGNAAEAGVPRLGLPAFDGLEDRHAGVAPTVACGQGHVLIGVPFEVHDRARVAFVFQRHLAVDRRFRRQPLR